MHPIRRAINLTKDLKNAILQAGKHSASAASLIAREQIEALQSKQRALDSRRLASYGFKAYSQSDEDGILQEIFSRIGTANRTFIEFGCGDGLENNSTYLLACGWTGTWFDAVRANVASIRQLHDASVKEQKLVVEQQMLTAANVNQILSGASKANEIDLLSIDIDGNDYWIWEAITNIRARVVVIEYNATFRPPVNVVQQYHPDVAWNGTNAFGASLKALEELGRRKGYALVGCNLAGTNAFFIRSEYVDERFHGPFSAENHYMPPNYDLFLLTRTHSHPPGVGAYVVDPERGQAVDSQFQQRVLAG